MTKEEQKAKIIATIERSGWHTADIYWDAARELEASGKIKREVRTFLGEVQKSVWVAPNATPKHETQDSENEQ